MMPFASAAPTVGTAAPITPASRAGLNLTRVYARHLHTARTRFPLRSFSG